MAETKIKKGCENCAFGSCGGSMSSNALWTNYKCVYHGTARYVAKTDLIKETNRPHWCPLNARKTTNENMDYYEKRRLWEKMKPVMTWEDIHEGVVYHIPPYLGEQRYDIIVTTKTSASINYKRLNSTNDKLVYTAYKESDIVRKMVPHMIKKIEVKRVV